MFAWYHQFTATEKRTFWACFAGWGLDAMDVQIYSFLIPTLVALWGLTTLQAGTLGTAALIASAIGGFGTGLLADRFGRVRLLQIAILWYALFTFLSGFVTSYEQLFVMRILQGLGFGGEWAAGAVLIGETIRSEHRGKAVGCMQSAYAVGWGLAALLSTIALTALPQDYAWRVMFWIGIAPALLVLFVRRYVKEPAIFLASQAKDHRSAFERLSAIFAPGMLRITLLSSLLALGIQGSSYAIITWLPTYLRTVRNLTAAGAGYYVLIVTFGAFCGYIASAYLTDAVGRRRNFVVYAIGCWVVDFFYMYAPLGNTAVLILGFPFGFFTQGIYASLGPYFTELFPTRMRATGQSFAYNFGRSIGACFVLIVGILNHYMPLDRAIGALSLGGYCLTLVAVFLLPETLAIELDHGEKPAPTT
jgi:MFS family permease